ncbi:MAG: hypothetical protein A2Z34_02805 [Planctomycetes bacterium RBG_16_59_8]|nr:MAG: hypothetical protein A2Z34_02805 [Planctomycetes bacterium RBG_16_59_8]
MTGDMDNRKYKRLGTNWIGKIRQKALPDELKYAGETRIRNISMGGVFIDTSIPFAIGTFVEIDFTIPGSSEPIHAEGIIRWSNTDRNANLPVGMGLEFIKVSTKSRSVITSYIDETVSVELLNALTRTELHKSALKFYCRKIGESFELDILANFLNCGHPQLLEVLQDFAARRLVNFSGKSVLFTPPQDQTTAEVLRAWYKKQG